MPTGPDVRSLLTALSSLYAQELAQNPGGYLEEHARPHTVQRHIDAFCWYAEHLPESGRILDWGCNHGPDLCLLREAFGDRYELHGCDFAAPEAFPVFRGHARAEYRQLTQTVGLPYPTGHFAMVVASGVLEHVAMDSESLKELHRVLQPGGLLMISYLPYWLSFREWYQRRVVKSDFHRKRYSPGQLQDMLLRAGFWTDTVQFHSSVPSQFLRWREMDRVRKSLVRLMWPARWLRWTLASWLLPRNDVLCCLATARSSF